MSAAFSGSFFLLFWGDAYPSGAYGTASLAADELHRTTQSSNLIYLGNKCVRALDKICASLVEKSILSGVSLGNTQLLYIQLSLQTNQRVCT